MSRVCKLTGKKALRGHNVSHSNQKTNRARQVNLQDKYFYIPELKRGIRLRLSARAIKTINKKGGIYMFLMEKQREGMKVL